jgi:thymidylate synthase
MNGGLSRKLKDKPDTKAATIPLIIPNEDEGYIPCVSLLDFKIRKNKLMLVAMCRSIDCGKKLYANLIAAGSALSPMRPGSTSPRPSPSPPRPRVSS